MNTVLCVQCNLEAVHYDALDLGWACSRLSYGLFRWQESSWTQWWWWETESEAKTNNRLRGDFPLCFTTPDSRLCRTADWLKKKKKKAPAAIKQHPRRTGAQTLHSCCTLQAHPAPQLTVTHSSFVLDVAAQQQGFYITLGTLLLIYFIASVLYCLYLILIWRDGNYLT